MSRILHQHVGLSTYSGRDKYLINENRRQSTELQLKYATYNVRMLSSEGKLLELEEELERINCDIIGMNETTQTEESWYTLKTGHAFCNLGKQNHFIGGIAFTITHSHEKIVQLQNNYTKLLQ